MNSTTSSRATVKSRPPANRQRKRSMTIDPDGPPDRPTQTPPGTRKGVHRGASWGGNHGGSQGEPSTGLQLALEEVLQGRGQGPDQVLLADGGHRLDPDHEAQHREPHQVRA